VTQGSPICASHVGQATSWCVRARGVIVDIGALLTSRVIEAMSSDVQELSVTRAGGQQMVLPAVWSGTVANGGEPDLDGLGHRALLGEPGDGVAGRHRERRRRSTFVADAAADELERKAGLA
jgi:hypothetical protein